LELNFPFFKFWKFPQKGPANFVPPKGPGVPGPALKKGGQRGGGGDYKIRGRGDLRLTSQQLRPMNDVRCVRAVQWNVEHARYLFAPKRNRESDVTMMRNDIMIVLCVLLLFVTTGETFQTKIQENKPKEKCRKVS